MVVEHHIHSGEPDDSSSAMAMIVAIVGIVVVVGLAFLALRSSGYLQGNSTPSQIDVDVDTGGGQ